MGPEAPLRVAILWKQLSGYAAASFHALAAEGVEVLLVHPAAKADAPYDDARLRGEMPGHSWTGAPSADRLGHDIEAFAPHALVVSSWDVGPYRRLARAMKGRALRILCMDNAWLGTPKQWGGRLVSPLAIRPAYDVAFLPGERQAAFARRLGFGDDRILWGLYTCDHAAFSPVARTPVSARRAAFLFVGRLAPEKGVDVLTRAYLRYRATTATPWPLLVCGAGPLAGSLAAVPGVELRGFVQPDDLPDVFARARCLVLPSTFEPWGVVIHEAAAAGLAVVCSTTCGASTRLVLDGYNGEVVRPGDTAHLAGAMARIAVVDPASLAAMGERSAELARQLTPGRWARYLTDRIPDLCRTVGIRTPPRGGPSS